MAVEGGSSWTDIFVGLPPQLQGAAAVVAAAVVGWMGYRKFISRLLGNDPASTDFAVGDPTSFADMTSVKKLSAAVEQLTMQMMKSAVATDSNTAGVGELLAKFGELCDLFAQHLVDLREQREEEELEVARKRGFEEGLRSRAPSRRAAAKKPGRISGETPRTTIMLKLFAGLALACLVTPVFAQDVPPTASTCQSLAAVRTLVKTLGAASSIIEIPPKDLIGSDVVGIKTIVFVVSPQGLVFGVEGSDGCMSAPMLLGPLAGPDGKPALHGSGMEIGS